MSDLLIKGGTSLNGEITPAGNKNSALPVLCATLLTDETVTIRNFPDLTDVNKLVDLMVSMGSEINWDKKQKVITINNKNFKDSFGNEGFPLGMRGAILLLGPLTTRMKEISVKENIGGCSLGIRELDPHLEVLEKLGADIDTKNNNLTIKIKNTLVGGYLWQDYMSVTTTENFLMASVKAKGESTMVNAASEPHVQDLCNMLSLMGADIRGIGTSTISVKGTTKLKGTEFTISSDHHEITTLLALGAMTGGEIRVRNSEPEHFPLINKSFAKFNVDIEYEKDTAIVRTNQELKIIQPYTKNMLAKLEAAPWPYFPTDLMPLMVALAVKSEGSIMFWNKLYEGGFFWIPELIKFGAHIVMCDPHRIIVYGNKPLTPTEVNAPNIIRATVALMMVGLSIQGETIIRNADTIKRAHPNFIENLNTLGAKLEWIN
jgi:UDP-N-acetylglucosamine 1-carboxyvinyltransferase